MPGVIDISEIAEESRSGVPDDTIEVTLSLHPALVNKITDLLSGTTGHRRRCAYLETEPHDAGETMLDTLARQHPYLYIKSLAG